MLLANQSHLHVMDKSQNHVVLPRPPPPPLEQCATGAPEHFLFDQNQHTGHLLLLLTKAKLMKKRCNDTFNTVLRTKCSILHFLSEFGDLCLGF